MMTRDSNMIASPLIRCLIGLLRPRTPLRAGGIVALPSLVHAFRSRLLINELLSKFRPFHLFSRNCHPVWTVSHLDILLDLWVKGMSASPSLGMMVRLIPCVHGEFPGPMTERAHRALSVGCALRPS
jgi:hypothetical protein